jgi:hypothetical protein
LHVSIMSWLGCLQFAVVSFVSLYRSYGVSERASQQQLSLVNAMSLCENDAGVAGSVDVTEDARAFIQNVCRDGAEGGGVKILLVLDIGSSSIRCSPFVILRAGNSFENVVPLMECNSKLLFAIVSDDINDRSRKKNPGNVNTDMDQLDSIFNNVNAIVNESVSKLKFFFGQFRVTKWKIIGIGFSSLAMSLVATQCNERSNNRHVNQVSPLFVYSCSETSSTSIRQAVKELKSMTDKADISALVLSCGIPAMHLLNCVRFISKLAAEGMTMPMGSLHGKLFLSILSFAGRPEAARIQGLSPCVYAKPAGRAYCLCGR